MPEYQDIATGDVLPAVPGATDGFVVASVERPRALVLVAPGPDGRPRATWEHVLEPLDRGRTRLIVRGRVSPRWLDAPRDRPVRPPLSIERAYSVMARIPRPLLFPIAALGHWLMQARQLRGIKRRAEAR